MEKMTWIDSENSSNLIVYMEPGRALHRLMQTCIVKRHLICKETVNLVRVNRVESKKNKRRKMKSYYLAKRGHLH